MVIFFWPPISSTLVPRCYHTCSPDERKYVRQVFAQKLSGYTKKESDLSRMELSRLSIQRHGRWRFFLLMNIFAQFFFRAVTSIMMLK